MRLQREQEAMTGRVRRPGERNRRRFGGYLLFAFLITFFLILIISMVGNHQFGLPQKVGLELLAVVQKPVSRITAHASGVWRDYIALWGVEEENRLLREEVRQYKLLNSEYQEAVATNIRLRKLLDFKETLPMPTATARIIGKDPGFWFHTVIIDRGGGDGVLEGMPVVTAEGVVGQVINIAPRSAKILLANDPNSAIEAMVQRSRVRCIVKGDGRGLDMFYVLKSSDVVEGDLVVTSEMGGIFPKGLIIGTVTSVASSERGMFLQIAVAPAVDFSQLENVVVIMKNNALAE